VLNNKFQYDDLEAPGCLPYPVVWPCARSRGHLRNVQYSGLEVPGVCRTQSCDPSHSLEITWGPKMSKIKLNCLIICLFIYLYKLSSYLHMLAFGKSRYLKLLLLLLRWCLVYMFVFVEVGVLCLWWVAYSLHDYLNSWLLVYYPVMVYLCGFTLIL
jgi:hypothetical protein